MLKRQQILKKIFNISGAKIIYFVPILLSIGVLFRLYAWHYHNVFIDEIYSIKAIEGQELKDIIFFMTPVHYVWIFLFDKIGVNGKYLGLTFIIPMAAFQIANFFYVNALNGRGREALLISSFLPVCIEYSVNISHYAFVLLFFQIYLLKGYNSPGGILAAILSILSHNTAILGICSQTIFQIIKYKEINTRKIVMLCSVPASALLIYISQTGSEWIGELNNWLGIELFPNTINMPLGYNLQVETGLAGIKNRIELLTVLALAISWLFTGSMYVGIIVLVMWLALRWREFFKTPLFCALVFISLFFCFFGFNHIIEERYFLWALPYVILEMSYLFTGFYGLFIILWVLVFGNKNMLNHDIDVYKTPTYSIVSLDKALKGKAAIIDFGLCDQLKLYYLSKGGICDIEAALINISENKESVSVSIPDFGDTFLGKSHLFRLTRVDKKGNININYFKKISRLPINLKNLSDTVDFSSIGYQNKLINWKLENHCGYDLSRSALILNGYTLAHCYSNSDGLETVPVVASGIQLVVWGFIDPMTIQLFQNGVKKVLDIEYDGRFSYLNFSSNTPSELKIKFFGSNYKIVSINFDRARNEHPITLHGKFYRSISLGLKQRNVVPLDGDRLLVLKGGILNISGYNFKPVTNNYIIISK